MQAPFQVVALDDDSIRNLAIHPSLKLWSDVNQERTVPDCVANLVWPVPRQPGTGPGKEPVQSMIATVGIIGSGRGNQPGSSSRAATNHSCHESSPVNRELNLTWRVTRTADSMRNGRVRTSRAQTTGVSTSRCPPERLLCRGKSGKRSDSDHGPIPPEAVDLGSAADPQPDRGGAAAPAGAAFEASGYRTPTRPRHLWAPGSSEARFRAAGVRRRDRPSCRGART